MGGNARGAAAEPEAFRRALLRHFYETRRDLPWRADRTPYRVMVSEFMLQQTRADTAAPYYARWLRRFPDWTALADASRDDVLLAWKGLGYYARAANLHRTAVVVRERHGGRLPSDPAVLATLPGVGEYTAGAVASIAFGVQAPAVDGNVRRVLARLLDAPHPSVSQLRAEAGRLLDPHRPGDFNEALMELGATVCVPRAPRCGVCPVADFCRARLAGTAAERPAPRPKPTVRRVAYAVAVALDVHGRTILVRRPKKGLLAGMWEFPSVEIVLSDQRTGSDEIEAAARQRLAALGLARTAVPASRNHRHDPSCVRLAPVRHAFTHMRAVYHPVILRCGVLAMDTAESGDGSSELGTGALEPGDGGSEPGNSATEPGSGATEPILIVHVDDLAGVALPVAQQKIGVQLAAALAAVGPMAGSPAFHERSSVP